MRTLLIVNPASLRGQARQQLPRIVAQLRKLAVPFELLPTTGPGQGIALARHAARLGFARVVAVGGDGTCNEVINGLLQAKFDNQEDNTAGETPLFAVIPTGSGNDLACSLGMPLDDLAAACIVLKHGQERIIDAARLEVDGQPRYFANSIGLGLEAEVTIRSHRVRYLRGFAMYLWSALNVIMRGRWPYHVRLTFDGESEELSLTLMAIGNGIRSGGGFYLTPNAAMDDGLFDVCYGPAVSRLTLFNLLPRAVKGAHLSHPAVSLRRAAQVELRVLEGPGIPAHADGEVVCIYGKQLKFTVLPQALRVWGPQENKPAIAP